MKRHSAFHQLYYHFVWGTKNRLPMITPAIELRLYTYLAAKCHELNIRLLAINGTEDHVHLLLEVPATMSVAEVAQRLKGASSHVVNSDGHPTSGLYWQDGYGALTLRKTDIDRVATYIRRQKEHHASGDVSPLLERQFVE